MAKCRWEGGVEKILNALRQKTECLDWSPTVKKLREEECGDSESGKRGKVVLYVTSLKAIRETHERCKQALHILQAHRIQFTTKDVFLHPDYSTELAERMGSSSTITLPQLFVAGDCVGDGEVLVEMNETGELEELLQHFKGDSSSSSSGVRVCGLCDGRGFVLCLWCRGTKKGIKNAFNDLKCTICNQNGLQKCPECS